MITDPQSWSEAGIPDNLMFRQYFAAFRAFVKAENERMIAATGDPFPGTDEIKFFYPRGVPFYSVNAINALLYRLGELAPYFVKPDKVPNANSYRDCFWTLSEIRAEIGTDLWPESQVNFKPFLPDWPIRYVAPIYNAINLMRYLPTTRQSDWPDFNYEDKNSTFKFKAEGG